MGTNRDNCPDHVRVGIRHSTGRSNSQVNSDTNESNYGLPMCTRQYLLKMPTIIYSSKVNFKYKLESIICFDKNKSSFIPHFIVMILLEISVDIDFTC